MVATRYGENGRNWINPGYEEFKQTPILSSAYSYLSDKYGTPYFSLHGTITVIEKKSMIGLVYFFIPFTIPYGIVYMSNPNAHTYYYHVVVNVETGEMLYREVRYLKRKAVNSVLDGMVYDSFRILKKARKQ